MKRSWVAAEAIDHQGRSNLFEKIKSGINQARSSGNLSNEKFSEIGLSSDIEDECGISTRIIIVNVPWRNAGISIPQIDRNHPVISELGLATDMSLGTVKKFMNGKVVGSIDKRNSRVYGFFSKIECTMYITTGLLNDSTISDGKVGGIILHELGHVFTYYERLIDCVTMNYALAAAADEILKLKSTVERVRVIDDLDKILKVKIGDKDTIVDTDDKGKLLLHLSTTAYRERRNVEGDVVYSYRGFEAASDQFAARHGAGLDVAAFLIDLNSGMLNSSKMCWPAHVMFEVLKMTAQILALAGAGLISPILLVTQVVILACARPMDKIYDEPKARVERIEREMVAELKNRDLPQIRRQEVLTDVETLRQMSKTLEDKRGYFEAIWAYIIPAGNESRKKMEFQQQLERLASNDLYLASALFS